MFLSVFDIFKIGIGPSSSHTVGPMVAAARFLDELLHGDWPRPAGIEPGRIIVSLLGSLAFTGMGHGTDTAVMLGLCGAAPDSVDPDHAGDIVAALAREKRLAAPGCQAIAFDPDTDLVFDYGPPLPGHANAMTFIAFDIAGRQFLKRIYYSIGGGSTNPAYPSVTTLALIYKPDSRTGNVAQFLEFTTSMAGREAIVSANAVPH